MFDQVASNKLKSTMLMTGFVLFVILLGFVFDEISGAGGALSFCFFFIALFSAVGSYWYSDRIVLGMSRARQVTKDSPQGAQIVNHIEGLAIASGLPVPPSVYVIEDPAPNAFATGRDPQHAAIALTTGLLEKMGRYELEGVIAHELSHIINYDTRLQMLTAVLAGTVAYVSEWMARSIIWGGIDEDRGGNAGLAAVGLVLALLAPVAALVMRMAISRKREYLADANAAVLTRYPDGLAEALRKIAADPAPLRVANRATEPLWIYNPLKDRRKGLDRLFDTHPPIEERIRRLEAM
ncbi:MAG: zinc metalloprotease HtpX [Coriobacteriaceae bacterium]|nr:zinc metalloprotease HtpX [Coriobacteriaceae bacterium]